MGWGLLIYCGWGRRWVVPMPVALKGGSVEKILRTGCPAGCRVRGAHAPLLPAGARIVALHFGWLGACRAPITLCAGSREGMHRASLGGEACNVTSI